MSSSGTEGVLDPGHEPRGRSKNGQDLRTIQAFPEKKLLRYDRRRLRRCRTYTFRPLKKLNARFWHPFREEDLEQNDDDDDDDLPFEISCVSQYCPLSCCGHVQ